MFVMSDCKETVLGAIYLKTSYIQKALYLDDMKNKKINS